MRGDGRLEEVVLCFPRRAAMWLEFLVNEAGCIFDGGTLERGGARANGQGKLAGDF